jgi:hypothetical protein
VVAGLVLPRRILTLRVARVERQAHLQEAQQELQALIQAVQANQIRTVMAQAVAAADPPRPSLAALEAQAESLEAAAVVVDLPKS